MTMTASTTTKATIVFVHGAWHNPHCWDAIRSRMHAAGYETVAPALRCCDWEDPITSHQDDVAVVRRELEVLVNAGKEVLLVMHSYGGHVGGGAIEGLEKGAAEASVTEVNEGGGRGGGRGRKGGVIGAVFLAAFLVETGQFLLQVFDEQPPYIEEHPANPAFLNIKGPQTTFYNGISPAKAQAWISAMRPQALAAFTSPATSMAWQHVPCTYVSTRRDQGVYPELQDRMVDMARRTARFPFRVMEMDVGHSVWLSKGEEIVGVIGMCLEGEGEGREGGEEW